MAEMFYAMYDFYHNMYDVMEGLAHPTNYWLHSSDLACCTNLEKIQLFTELLGIFRSKEAC